MFKFGVVSIRSGSFPVELQAKMALTAKLLSFCSSPRWLKKKHVLFVLIRFELVMSAHVADSFVRHYPGLFRFLLIESRHFLLVVVLYAARCRFCFGPVNGFYRVGLSKFFFSLCAWVIKIAQEEFHSSYLWDCAFFLSFGKRGVS